MDWIATIMGITLVALPALLLLAVGLWFWWRARWRAQRHQEQLRRQWARTKPPDDEAATERLAAPGIVRPQGGGGGGPTRPKLPR